MNRREITKKLISVDNDILDIHSAICQALVNTPETQYEELQEMIDKHRKKAFVTCDENCFCWEIEKYLLEQQLKK